MALIREIIKFTIIIVLFNNVNYIFGKFSENAIKKTELKINSYIKPIIRENELFNYIRKLNPILLGIVLKDGKTFLDAGPAEGVSDIFYRNLEKYLENKTGDMFYAEQSLNEYLYYDGLNNLDMLGSKKYFDNLYKLGIKYINNDITKYYSVKRYLVYFYKLFSIGGYPQNYYTDTNDIYHWRYGLWALYDNDSKTTAVIDTKTFTINLKKSLPIKIFNGNGRTEKLYNENARIKTLSGSGTRIITNSTETIKTNELVIIRLEDHYGWQEVKLPEWVQDEEVGLKVTEVYTGMKFNDVCVSEIDEGWQFGKDEAGKIRQYIYDKLLPQLRLKD